MSSFPARRLSNPSLNNHHSIHVASSNRFTNSLNRLASSSTTPSPFNPLPSRFSRRARLFSLLFVFFIGFFYWIRLGSSSNPWNNPFSTLKSTSDQKSDSIPTVTRDVLERLERLAQSQFDDEERAVEELIYSNHIRLNQTFHPGLPFVTALPADRHPSSSSNSNQKKKRNCPDQLPYPCAFLVAGYVGEQETKAQMHLHQLGLLAMALNRTLVLPQLSQSRMSSCLEHPFDLYYQPDALHRLGVRTLTHQKFLEWFTTPTADSDVPSARLLAILTRQQDPSAPSQGSVSFDHASTPNHRLDSKWDRRFCLRNTQNQNSNSQLKNKLPFNLDAFSPLTIVAPDRWYKSTQNREQFSEKIVQSVRDSENPLSNQIRNSQKIGRLRTPQSSIGRPDILVVNYELRYPFLDPASNHSQTLIGNDWLGEAKDQSGSKLEIFQHFPYASIWVRFVEQLVNQLPSMIGVHWRQESIPIADLKMCAQSLITTLESIKRNYPSLQAIYLSTDYPIEQVHRSSLDTDAQQNQRQPPSSRAHSGTFSKLTTKEHHQIMKKLIENKFSSSLIWLTFNSLIDNLDLPPDLVHELIQLPIFRDVKELDRMMKITKFDQQGEYRNVENQKEIKRLIKEKFKLKIEEGGEGGEVEGEAVKARGDKTVDAGIIGILEKLILIRSNFFLTGVPNQCSKTSSFTQQVVQDRQLVIDDTFRNSGYLLDLDFLRSDSNSKQNFNLVEFWS